MGLRQGGTGWIRRADRDQDGAVAVMAAVLVMALLASAALAVDVGRAAYASRDQQGATDRAALDGVRVLHEAILDGVTASGLVDQVYEVADSSLEDRNPPPGGTARRSLYRVDLGRTGADSAFDEECRGYFVESGDELPDSETMSDGNPCEGSVEDLNVDAVRLWTYSEIDYVLPLGEQRSAELRKAAVAASDAQATISAASTTLTLENGAVNDVATELLSGLVGSEDVLSLGLIGHEGIAGVTLTLGELIESEHLTVGSVDKLLTAEIAVADLLRASADAIMAGDDSSAGQTLAAAVDLLGQEVPDAGLPPIQLGIEQDGILDFETGGAAGANAAISALDLVTAGLQLANRGNAVSLDAGAFGDLPVTLEVVEPAVIARGRPGKVDGDWQTVARTAQLELVVELPIGPDVVNDEGSIADRVAHYENRLSPAEGFWSGCGERESIVEDIDDELDAVEQQFPGASEMSGVRFR